MNTNTISEHQSTWDTQEWASITEILLGLTDLPFDLILRSGTSDVGDPYIVIQDQHEDGLLCICREGKNNYKAFGKMLRKSFVGTTIDHLWRELCSTE